MNRAVVTVISFFMMILPGLFLLGSGTTASATLGIIEIASSATVSFLPSDKGKSVARYVPLLIVAGALIISQGYFQRLFAIAPIVPILYANDVAFLLAFLILGIFLSMVSGTDKVMTKEMSQAGFNNDELKKAVSSFNSNMMLIGFGTLVLSAFGYLLISILPQISVGFFPAVISFGIIYLLLFRVVFSGRKKVAR